MIKWRWIYIKIAYKNRKRNTTINVFIQNRSFEWNGFTNAMIKQRWVTLVHDMFSYFGKTKTGIDTHKKTVLKRWMNTLFTSNNEIPSVTEKNQVEKSSVNKKNTSCYLIRFHCVPCLCSCFFCCIFILFFCVSMTRVFFLHQLQQFFFLLLTLFILFYLCLVC